MKRAIVLLLVNSFCVTLFAGNVRFTEQFATHIPAQADLDIRWIAPTSGLPASIWVYHLSPRKLSPEIISNLMVACSFTAKDGTTNGDLVIFKSGDRELRLSWPWGIIDYNSLQNYSITNIVKNVPSTNEVVKLVKQFLPKLGIPIADIAKAENSSQPEFYPAEMGGTDFIGTNAIHKIDSCEVHFSRVVDGIEFVSIGTGGEGEIKFGGGGKVVRILITWRNMEREKQYATFTPETMIKLIRGGKAIQGGVSERFGEIDWRKVKRVTIKEITPLYYAGGDRYAPTDWLKPYARLWTTVETDHGSVDVELDCPIIDEGQPAVRK